MARLSARGRRNEATFAATESVVGVDINKAVRIGGSKKRRSVGDVFKRVWCVSAAAQGVWTKKGGCVGGGRRGVSGALVDGGVVSSTAREVAGRSAGRSRCWTEGWWSVEEEKSESGRRRGAECDATRQKAPAQRALQRLASSGNRRLAADSWIGFSAVGPGAASDSKIINGRIEAGASGCLRIFRQSRAGRRC